MEVEFDFYEPSEATKQYVEDLLCLMQTTNGQLRVNETTIVNGSSIDPAGFTFSPKDSDECHYLYGLNMPESAVNELLLMLFKVNRCKKFLETHGVLVETEIPEVVTIHFPDKPVLNLSVREKKEITLQ